MASKFAMAASYFSNVTHVLAGINAPAIQSSSLLVANARHQKLSHTQGGQPRITPRLHPVSTTWIAPN